MKIRKTTLNEQLTNVYIYENKKEDFFVVSVPSVEWSITFTYDEEKTDLVSRMTVSLQKQVDVVEAEPLAMRIYQWSREL